MKAYEIRTATGIEALTLVDHTDPQPGPDQVLIRVRATALNYRDLVVARGQYPGMKTSIMPLSDGAGDVVAVGEGVTRVQVGDRVAGIFFQDWLAGPITKTIMRSDLGGSLDGMLAEYKVLPQEGLVRLPEHLSYSEGATLPCAAVTAWHALVAQGKLMAGETVLVLGTGGVSMFALQLAKLHGAWVIITSSSDEKLTRARSLGADETINYKTTPDWDKQVFELTQGNGVDHVIEVGGPGTLMKSMRSVRYGGRISLIGVLAGAQGEVNPLLVMQRSVTLQGIYVGSRDMFEAMNRAIAHNKLQPVIDRVFAFEQAPAAYQYLQSGNHFGKVVIEH